MHRISVVIPVYRGAETISHVVNDLLAQLPHIAETYEIVLVEDGSPDDGASWAVVQDLAQRHDAVRAFRMMRNFGQHNALLCGIRAAQYEIIATMDDDGQHPAAELPRMLAKLDSGYDVVYGKPEVKQHDFGRRLGSTMIRFALRSATGLEAARDASAFRVFRTHLRDAFAAYTSPYVSIDVLLSWGTTRFAVVTVTHLERQAGQSTYNLRKLVQLAITMLTGFSTAPLRLASMLGFGTTALGVLLLFYVVIVRLVVGVELPGFTFLASIIAIFSGVQMFTIGIIGEYLLRMHFRLMDKPSYVVMESAAASQTHEGQTHENPTHKVLPAPIQTVEG